MTDSTRDQHQSDSLWLCKSEPQRGRGPLAGRAGRDPELVRRGRARRALEDLRIEKELGLR